jgi:hypothetical protein
LRRTTRRRAIRRHRYADALVSGDTATQAAYYTGATTVAGSLGTIYSATDIVAESHEMTSVSASATVTAAQGVFKCDATSGNVVLTLPAASTTTAKKFKVYKTDATTNTCGFLRAGSDTINAGTAATTAVQYGLVEVEWLTTATWGASYGITSISLTADVSGILPVANGGTGSATPTRSIYIPAGNFDVNGSCVLGAAAVLLASGPKTASITCTDSTADSIETVLVMPDGWDAGTITIELTLFNVGSNAMDWEMCRRRGSTEHLGVGES